jgi:hypothetical protein
MAMEKYGFFQGTVEDPRDYDSADTATAFRTLASNGVANVGDNLEVTADGLSMSTELNYGSAMILGRYYVLNDDGGGIKTFAHSPEASLNRIDRIVLRLNLTDRVINAVKLVGAADASPTPPALTRTSTVYELSLAQVYIGGGDSVIEAADVTDEREDDDVCGMIAPESLRPSVVQALIAAAVDAATDDVVRYTAQSLSDADALIARGNIKAMYNVNTGGLLVKTFDGVAQIAFPAIDYALPTAEYLVTLTAAGWVGASAPYTQDLTISGMTADTKGVSVGLAHTATDEQYTACLAALIRATGQSTDTLSIRAIGEKPTVDIPVIVRIASIYPGGTP